jgi:hypothetical protein
VVADYETVVNQRLIVAGVMGVARKTLTFTGAAGLGQSGSPIPLFNLTGAVYVERIAGIGMTTPTSAGGGTLALGVTGSASLFIAATTATTIATGLTWQTTTANATGLAVPATNKEILIAASIIGTVAVAGITAGVIQVVCYYRPASSDGALVAA